MDISSAPVSQKIDYLSHLEDEVALEGLDGITVQGLWLRLAMRPNFPAHISLNNDSSKEFFWSLIAQDEEIEFFCLPEPRSPLTIFNRYDYIDDEVGLVVEPKEDILDVYPNIEVDDKEKGVRGSCATYYTRKNISDDVRWMSLEEALEKYGSQLVLVGNQALRDRALSISAAVDKYYDLRTTQYVMLERIGRSRTMGEITYGKNSLAVMKVEPKTMFYHRKRLLKLNLITKQTHRQRSIKGNISSSSLLHLPRFYVRRRPKFIIVIQKIMEILQKKRDFTCTVVEVKEEIGLQTIFSKKIFKSLDFMKHIQIVNIPYRDIYPNATVKEWKFKAKNEEKTLRCLQLVNPDTSFDDELPQGDEEEEMDEYDSSSGILDLSNVVYGRSLLQQAYIFIRAAGPEGMSQMELSKVLGVTKLDSRTLCRSLSKRDVIHSLMKDIGKQRVTKFVSNKYASTGHLLQEYEAERKKMLEIVEDSEQNVGGVEEEEQHLVQYQASTPSTSRIMDTGVLENLQVGVQVSSSQPETFDSSQEGSNTLADQVSLGHMENGEVTITQSKPLTNRKKLGKIFATPEKATYVNHKRVSPHLTTRMIKRANIIIDAVNKFKVIDDALKLQKMIINAEQNEGVEGKMDKKSLTRLLDRLASSGYLQKLEVKIQVGEKSRVITFVLHSSINKNSKVLQMAILQQKHKFMVQVSSSKRDPIHHHDSTEKGEESQSEMSCMNEDAACSPAKEMSVKDAVKQEPSVGFSVLEMEKMHNIPKISTQSPVKSEALDPPMVSIKGNVGPKFVRMQEFHKLLFYLVYGYEGKTDLDQDFAWKTVVDSVVQDLDSESLNDYPTIYVPEVSWKMFIPPLPKHTVVTVDGWIFIVDVLLRLPLAIFVQVVRVIGESNLLTSYINHPIKQNMLVKDLPPDLRRCILNNRRYVTYVMELCNRLCHVGLLQKGPQIMKEKDQLFVYLNKKATLIDTTISSSGYHHISLDKEYVRKEYTFCILHDVIQYWYDMWTICMHTPLGAHMSVQGEKITIQVLHKKPEIIECITPRTFEEAAERDTGHIPGDERGAAGLDSAMFSHLKRNWSCLYSRFSTITQAPVTPPTDNSKGSDAMFSYAQYLRDSCIPGSAENSAVKNKLAGVRNVRLSIYKPKLEDGSKPPLPVSIGLVDVSKKRKKEPAKDEKTVKKSHSKEKTTILREIKVRVKAPKKPYYDEEDKAALRRMDKLRVDWNGAEDCILLLCKVTSEYMFPLKRAQIISFSVIRDLLHSRYPESRNKTSKACQRRINYIMKNPATEEQVAVLLEELKQDEEITKKFKPAKLSYKKPVLHKLYVNTFKELVRRLITKYASNESKNTKDLPESYAEFENQFKITRASVSLKEGPKLREMTSVSDVDHFVVHALIFSSLCTKQDRESWAYQLYLAYQKYPQKLLNTVLTSIRETKMISYKKCYNRSKYIRTCLPLSTSPFQLSLSYIYVFHMKYPYEVFGSCWEMTKSFFESKLEALPRCTLQLPDKTEDYGDGKEVLTSSVVLEEPVIDKPARNRKKPRKIGARAKSHGTRQKQQEQKQLLAKSESRAESNSQKMQEYLDTNLLELEEKGVQFSNTLVGGGCAAVLSLAAIKRLSFDITIPDQLIAIDNQNRDKEEGRSRLLEKIEYHEMVSGRKFALSEELNKTWFSPDEDIYTEKEDSTDPIPRDSQSPLVNDPNLYPEYCELQERAQTAIKRKPSGESNDNPLKKAKLLTFDQPEEDGSNSCQAGNEVEKDVSQRRKQHSQSRIRMYMMREQMGDMKDQPSEPGSSVCHGVFDNIFINTCKVSCKLKSNQNNDPQIPVPAGSAELAEIFMPITQDMVNKALTARKRVVLSSWTKLDSALSEWKGAKRDSKFLTTVKKLYNYIEEMKELGASAKEIKDEFDDPKLKIMEVLSEMMEISLVLRVGVDTLRWVVIQYSKPWLIRTNKMSRAKMNSTDAVRLSGVYDVDEGTEDEPKQKRCRRLVFPASEVKESELPKEDGDEKGDREREPSTSSSAEPRRRSGRTNIALLKKSCPKDAETPYSLPDIDQSRIAEQYEEIDVLVRPWVRLNGCLNRRVMDRMLGSVLCHVIDNPGISGCQIAKKFWPAVQPAHTYELLETLLTIRAVTRMSVKKMSQDSLFADEQDFDVAPVEDIDFDDNFSYEAEVDSILKLATFIGDKKYAQDFLVTCR